MDAELYRLQAARTDGTTNDRDRLLNATLGLCGETTELALLLEECSNPAHPENSAEIIKEIGDVCWYLVQACTATRTPIYNVFPATPETSHNSYNGAVCVLPRSASLLADFIKKHVFHHHELDSTDFILRLRGMAANLRIIAAAAGVTLEFCMEQNIEKLRRRYPEGFSTERSVNRSA